MPKDDFWDKLGKWYDPLGLHDFNKDGVHSWWEASDAEDAYYRELKEFEKRHNHHSSISAICDDWQLTCEDGSEYGLDPDDYDTEEEYEEALQEAKDKQDASKWRETCEDGSEYGLDPEDYDSEEEYEDALAEAMESEDSDYDDDDSDNVYHIPLKLSITLGGGEDRKSFSPAEERIQDAKEHLKYLSEHPNQDEYDLLQKKRCELILRDNCVASRYTDYYNGFEIWNAVLNEYKLPQEYIDNYDSSDVLSINLDNVKDYDISLLFKIVRWIFAEFYPYKELDEEEFDWIIIKLIDFEIDDDNHEKRYELICENRTFVAGAIGDSKSGNVLCRTDILYEALSRNDKDMVELFAIAVLRNSSLKPMSKIEIFEGLIRRCTYDCNLSAVKSYQSIVLPILDVISNDLVKRKINAIKKKIDEYLEYHDDDDDDDENLDSDDADENDEPLPFDKYAWRKPWMNNEYGLDPCKYDTIEEFVEDLERERAKKKQQNEAKKKAVLEDSKIYIYCGVMLPGAERPYSYRTEDFTIQIGDWVKVPVGADNRVVTGEVVSVGQYKHIAVPYSVSKTKMIIEKDYFHK